MCRNCVQWMKIKQYDSRRVQKEKKQKLPSVTINMSALALYTLGHQANWVEIYVCTGLNGKCNASLE